MTGIEWAVLAAGIGFVAFIGAWHLGGILTIMRMKPSSGRHPYFAVLFTFWGLLVLHISEILLGALAYFFALRSPAVGNLSETESGTFVDLLYFAGISFSTLGFTKMQADGPIRLLVMLQSLGGFMLTTWSATFVYTVWNDRFRSEDE